MMLKSYLEPFLQAFNERAHRAETLAEERHADIMKRRHDQNGKIELLDNKAYLLNERMSVLEHRIQAIDGGDTGTGGAIYKLEQGKTLLEQSNAEIKSDLRSVKDVSPNNPQMQEMQAWKNKWLGVAAAISIVGTIFALLSGVVAALFAVFHHMK